VANEPVWDTELNKRRFELGEQDGVLEPAEQVAPRANLQIGLAGNTGANVSASAVVSTG
jgi:hypothetical protein